VVSFPAMSRSKQNPKIRISRSRLQLPPPPAHVIRSSAACSRRAEPSGQIPHQIIGIVRPLLGWHRGQSHDGVAPAF